MAKAARFRGTQPQPGQGLRVAMVDKHNAAHFLVCDAVMTWVRRG